MSLNTTEPSKRSSKPKLVSKANGAVEDDLTAEALPEDVAAAPVDDLMAEALASPEDYGGGQSPVQTGFRVRKPAKDEWFRVHPTFGPRFAFYEIDTSKQRGQVFLIRQHMLPEFGAAARPETLRLCRTSAGLFYFWRNSAPNGGPGDTWARSRIEIAQRATAEWVAIYGAGDGGYLWRAPLDPSVFTEPEWPAGTPNDWVRMGFPSDLVIGDVNHEVVQYRRGLLPTL